MQQRALAARWHDGDGNTSRIAGQFQEGPQTCTRGGEMRLQGEGRALPQRCQFRYALSDEETHLTFPNPLILIHGGFLCRGLCHNHPCYSCKSVHIAA
jgi:hypothetical protein